MITMGRCVRFQFLKDYPNLDTTDKRLSYVAFSYS